MNYGRFAGAANRTSFNNDRIGFRDQLNFTLNVPKKLPVNRGAPSDQLAPIVRLDATQLDRVGFKLKYRVDEHSGAVIPRIWVAFPQQITIQSPILKRIRPESESFARFVIEMEF